MVQLRPCNIGRDKKGVKKVSFRSSSYNFESFKMETMLRKCIFHEPVLPFYFYSVWNRV